MRQNLNEEIARAIMIGDGRDEGDEAKISETHVRSIWHDDDLYTIHTTVDIEAARKELQGTNTSANFGENYIYAEAIIAAALYSREKYKGSGTPDFYCTPHLLNVMLLARDLNGRRIYDSKTDLAAALNVGNIYTAEQFEGKTRTEEGKTKKLLGIFVNLADYQIGSTRGGEITRFNQFDIDFNQEKYLIETMEKIYEALNDVHVRKVIVYGKTADKKLYYESTYATQVTKTDMTELFEKGLLLIDDGTKKLVPVSMTGSTVTTVTAGASAVESVTWSALAD